jgi:chemosensory pili system protein ChpA (sensor histidine kinase/response regulator)
MASRDTHDLNEATRQLQAGISVPAELLEIFTEESEEHLRIIYEGLDRLGEDPPRQEALAETRRSAHTLKGAAGAVGLEAAMRLAHRMEDLLDQLSEARRGPDARELQLLLSAADLLQDLTTRDLDVESTAQRLVQVYAGFSELLEATADTGAQASTGSTTDSDHRPAVTEDSQAASSAGQLPVTQPPAQWQGQERCSKSRPAEPASRFLRVPLRRLDELVSTIGEMMVNRSAMHQRLTRLESRIEEIFSTIQRTQATSFELQNRHHLESARLVSSTATGSGDYPQGHGQHLDTLEFDRYTDFHLLAQVLAEGNSDTEIVATELRSLKSDLENLLCRQDRLNRDAQNSLMHIRMVPLSGIVSKLQRTTRTVSSRLNKDIRLVIRGDHTELDKTVLDEIVDPLQHLLRNAMDHGVETPAERTAAGKPATAEICLEAVYQGTHVTLRLSDDGRGIDVARVRQKAIANGLVNEQDELTPEQIFRLIFLPGFSTTSQLSDVSGRGVGMDVVRDAITRLNGTIRVESQPGQGTAFTIQLPTTVGVTQALMAESAGSLFAIPLQSVRRILRLDPATVVEKDNRRLLQLGQQTLELRDLGTHLRLPDRHHDNHAGSGQAGEPPVLILRSGDEEAALLVDSVHGGHDVVVKDLGDHLRQVPGLIGAFVRGDGTPVPILDPAELVRCNQPALPPPQPCAVVSRGSSVRVSTAMVIDDSISVRRVTSSLLQTAGWDVVTARDGVDALEKLQDLEVPPDVFLCDMEMPRMDGIELVKRLRKQSEFAATPIVMVTSRASEKHRNLARDAGASDYVIKPYNNEQLLELIDELVQTARETIDATSSPIQPDDTTPAT